MSKDDYYDQLKQIDLDIDRLRILRHVTVLHYLEEIFPFHIGDIIAWDKYKGEVVEIQRWLDDTPMWEARRILKNGRLSIHTTYVRPYQNPVLYKKGAEQKGTGE